MARRPERGSGDNSLLPVCIGGPTVIRPYDEAVGRAIGEAAHAEVVKVFRRAKAFEVVSRTPRVLGFQVNCVIEAVTYDKEQRVLNFRVVLDLGQTPGTNTFDRVSIKGDTNLRQNDDIERAAARLAADIGKDIAADAVRLCERQAKTERGR